MSQGFRRCRPPDEVLTVEGEGTARIRSGDVVLGEARLEHSEIAGLFKRVGANMPVLVPRSEARFPPDSVIGEITIDVAGEQQQFYFLIDDETTVGRERPLQPAGRGSTFLAGDAYGNGAPGTIVRRRRVRLRLDLS